MSLSKNCDGPNPAYSLRPNNIHESDHFLTQKTTPKRLLLIEDDFIAQNIAKLTLADNFEITTANSAEEGLTLFDQKTFDIILTDIGLPGISGFEFAERVREKNKTLPIIAVSAHASSQDVKRKLEKIGINEILIKPVINDVLLNTTLYWADKKLSG